MRKATIFLMAIAIAIAASASTVLGVPPSARRSRFLANVTPSPSLSFYDCSKKPPSICLAPGSPGPKCCYGKCVNTDSAFQHCGNCNKVCKYGDTCCGGHCVNLETNKKNCGSCFNECAKHNCTLGFCNYAG